MSNTDQIVVNLPLASKAVNQITVSSEAFNAGAPIPDFNSAYYDNVSPRLVWSNVPTTANSIVLIAQDPDAPRAEPFVHWLIVNLPADISSLPENQSSAQYLGADFGNAQQGVNGFGAVGYLGPKPPPGHGLHHYHFQIFALDVSDIKLNDNFALADLLAAMENHVVAKGELIGTYQRDSE